MKLTSLTSVMRAACGGSTRSSSRAAYSPPNPPPAMTIRQAIGGRLPPNAVARRPARRPPARPLYILEHRARGQVARGPGHRASRMGARAGEVQPLDSAEPARAGPVLQHLPRQHLAVEDVPAGDAEAGLELPRAEREAVDDAVRKARAGEGEAGDGSVGGGARVDVGREGLGEERDDVAAHGRERRVDRGLARRLDERALGGPAGAGLRRGGVEVVEAVADVDGAAPRLVCP